MICADVPLKQMLLLQDTTEPEGTDRYSLYQLRIGDFHIRLHMSLQKSVL